MVVSQVEVQRRGGVCARYPSACIVRELLLRAGLLEPFRPVRVLDLTYGRGIFWAALPQALIYGIDIRRLDWVRRPRCFRETTAWAWRRYASEVESCLGGSPGLVAVDPPWSERGSSTRRYYGLDRAVGSVDAILGAALHAATHYGSILLVHLKDRWVPEGFETVEEILWEPVTRYLNAGSYTWFGLLRRAG